MSRAKPRNKRTRWRWLLIAVAAVTGACVACTAFSAIRQATPSGKATATARVVARMTEDARPSDTLMPTSPAERVEATVVRVIDGDTIEVSIEGQSYHLRYIGMDTPEMDESMGGVAQAANEALVGGQTLLLEKDVSEVDRYDRLLRYVYLADGTLVNAELVRLGYATAKAYPPDTKYQDVLARVEGEARGAGVGLWEAAEATEVPAPTKPAERSAAFEGGPVIIVEVDKRDEYVDLQNVSGAAVDLSGWVLVSEKGNQACPLGGVIEAGQTLRVWALAEDRDKAGFNCGFGSNIWNNSERDPAVLYDGQGGEVSRK